MRNPSVKHALCAAVVPLMLFGCAGPDDAASEAGATSESPGEGTAEAPGGPSETVPMAGTAWLTVGTDGAVQTTLIDAGGRYRDLRNGDLFAEGNWQQRTDGTICFEPDTGVGACWSTEVGDQPGNVIAIDGDGKRIELKRVTYSAPAEPEEEPAS